MSAAGLTAGIHGALRVSAVPRGEAAAKAIQLDIQYAPEPPFDCGHPDKAPKEIVAGQRAAFRPLTEKRQATATRTSWCRSRHSRNMVPVLEKAKVPVKLVVIEGAGHVFGPKQSTEIVGPAIMGWFEKYLTAKKEW